MCEVLQPDQIQVVFDTLLPLLFRNPLDTQAIFDIAIRGHPREKRVLLEHYAAIGSRPPDLDVIELEYAAARCDEARCHVEKGRFTAAARADDTNELAAGDIKGYVLNGEEGAGRGGELAQDMCSAKAAGHGAACVCALASGEICAVRSSMLTMSATAIRSANHARICSERL